MLYNMFNRYFKPVRVMKTVLTAQPVILITERLVPEGSDFVLHRFEGNQPMIDELIIADNVTAVERAKVGKVSPSASNFLSPSLEFQQQVAATMANLDDKFSYEAALAKLTTQSNPEPPANPEPPKSE